jgi:hypothetical protein
MEKLEASACSEEAGFVNRPVSKVLVLDNCPSSMESIRQFCAQNNLIGMTVRKNRLLSVLRTNIDLGAILLAEDYGASTGESLEIALKIHTLRPELPIMLRRRNVASLNDLSGSMQRVFCLAYLQHDMAPLQKVIEDYIFSLKYPNALVRGILEISESMLSGIFKNF